MKVDAIKVQISKWLPDTLLGRFIFGAGLVLILLLSTAGFVVFSVWIEDRFPSENPKQSLVPGLQRVLTKPIVDAISHQIERYIRNKLEAPFMNSDLTLDEAIRRFLDERIDIRERRTYAYRLAREGTPEAISALVKVFQAARPEDKAFMAQWIGSTGNSAVKEALWPLLDDADQRVVLAALRGLGAIGDADVSDKLAGLLADPGEPESVRIVAARGLGNRAGPAQRDVLVKALLKEKEPDVADEILSSLGRFPFPMVADTFEKYLNSPDTPQTMRVAAVEALAHSSREAVPFLLDVAGGDSDSEVRASAAWSLSLQGPHDKLGPTLADMAERENDPDVRRRIYEAMLPQSGIPPEQLLERAISEDDVATRVAGFNVLGELAGRGASESTTVFFDQMVVPELLQIAVSETSLNLRMRAVFALRRARTTAAHSALVQIADTPTPQIAEAARHGLGLGN